MDSPAVPDDQVAGVSADSDLFGASLFVPFDFLWIEAVPVVWDGAPFGLLVFAVRHEVGVVQSL